MPRAPYSDEDVYDDIIDYGFKFDGYDGVKGEAQERLKSFFTHNHPKDISDKTEALVDRIIEIHYGKLSVEEADPDLIGSNPTGDIKQRVERQVIEKANDYLVDLAEKGRLDELKKAEFKYPELQKAKEAQYYNQVANIWRDARDSDDLSSLRNLRSAIQGDAVVSDWMDEIDTSIKNIENGLIWRDRRWKKKV